MIKKSQICRVSLMYTVIPKRLRKRENWDNRQQEEREREVRRKR
jgi:hypothetical protein